MSSDEFDVCIIGGGIYGCGIAQAAAASGYRTLLLEKGAIASGTSSQSTKLIHGGLRYLEHAHFGLVYEALQERETLLSIAPELVTREWFYIPVYRDSRRPGWMIGCGLLLYFLLSGGRSRFRRLPRSRWEKMLPDLKNDGLVSVWAYQDAATDDAKLTRAVAASARSFGCDIHEHTELVSAIADNNGWVVNMSDQSTLRARVLVNAAGAWTNGIAGRIEPRPPTSKIRLVQGSHLMLDRECPSYIYAESIDGRVMFFRPWRGKSLAGSTETPFDGDPGKACINGDEIRAILATWNHYFPDHPCSEKDILETFCGLRALPAADGSAFAASRETTIVTSNDPAPYIAVYGGKLTTYRREAEKVIRALNSQLPGHHLADTRRIHLQSDNPVT